MYEASAPAAAQGPDECHPTPRILQGALPYSPVRHAYICICGLHITMKRAHRQPLNGLMNAIRRHAFFKVRLSPRPCGMYIYICGIGSTREAAAAAAAAAGGGGGGGGSGGVVSS